MVITIKDFYADWCGPCKTQEPILEDLSEDWDETVAIERIDVDEDTELANEYQVRSLPTLIVETDEEIIDRFVGVTQQEEIEASLERADA